jgi:hypothetical protein
MTAGRDRSRVLSPHFTELDFKEPDFKEPDFKESGFKESDFKELNFNCIMTAPLDAKNLEAFQASRFFVED